MPSMMSSWSPISSAQASPGVWATAAGAAAAAGYAGLRRIGNIIYSSAGKILHVLVGGMKVTPAKAKSLAKNLGMEAAAAALGISLVELAQMIMSDTERARRRSNRGISGANLRTTRRTMCKLNSINKYLGTGTARRSAPRCAPRSRSTCK